MDELERQHLRFIVDELHEQRSRAARSRLTTAAVHLYRYVAARLNMMWRA